MILVRPFSSSEEVESRDELNSVFLKVLHVIQTIDDA